jgi:hypothetical protein
MEPTLPPPTAGDMPVRQVEWPEALRFAALQSQLYDFDLSLSALGRIRHYSSFAPMDIVIQHSLYAIALIYYARVFKSGVRETCPIDGLSLTAAEREEHGRLIALRDKWLAHSVNAFDQVAVGIILSGFDDAASVMDVARIRLRKLSVTVEEAKQTEDFIRGVRRKVEAKNSEVYEQLLTRAKSTSPTELQRLPEISVEAPATDLRTVSRRR